MASADEAPVYICPMHSEVSESAPGQCPKCGMALVLKGARFAFLRHLIGSPLHIAIMMAVMAVIMAAAMIQMR